MAKTVRLSFTMDAIKDAHYLRQLEMEPNLSAAVRAAITAYYDRPSHVDLDAKLDQLLDALRNVQVVQGAGPGQEQPPGDSEPAKAKAGLEAMIKKFGGR